jgi:hemoglobin
MTDQLDTDAAARDAGPSLYERIGGRAGLERIVPDVVALHHENPIVGARFRAAATPVPDLVQHAIEFFATGLSGEPTYTGRSMPAAHAGMNITDEEFVAVLDDILAALDRHGIGQTEQAELLYIAYGMKHEIVGK